MSRPVGDAASGCAGKQRFTSGGEARRCAQHMQKAGKGVNAYRCPFCEGWHVGKSTSKVRR